MDTKRIRDIIDRELIVRTNKNNYIQEYGVVGVDYNIINSGGKTRFSTHYKISKVVFVTINGVTQVLGRDYIKLDDFTLEFNGVVLDGKTIAIGYFFEKITKATSQFPPRLNYFRINPTGGKDELISFAFDIENTNNDSYNIFWSIHKDGEANPLMNPSGEPLTGESLVVDGIDGAKEIKYQLSYTEYLERTGETIPFTLIVVYDMTDDGSNLDEKLVGDASYLVDGVTESVLSLEIVPEGIITQPVTDKVFDIEYSVDQGSYDTLTWRLVGPDGTIEDSGDEADMPLSRQMTATYSFDSNSASKTYRLYVTENGSEKSVVNVIIVNIAAPVLGASAAWWAKSRYSEVATDTNQFRILTEEGAVNYWTPLHNNLILNTGTNLTIDIDIAGSAQVIADEQASGGDPGFHSQRSIFKVPKAWGNVHIAAASAPGTALSGWTFQEGDAADDYNWWIRTDEYTLGGSFVFVIKKL